MERVDPRPLLLKQFIWDMFPHEADMQEIQRRLGLVPDTDDGLEKEHEDSDCRLTAVEPLMPALEFLASYAAEVSGMYLIACIEHNSGETVDTDPEFLKQFGDQNAEVIYQSAIAILARLMDTNVLTWGSSVTSDPDWDKED